MSQSSTDILMHRPDLENLPSLPPLPGGYRLRQLSADIPDAEMQLAHLLERAFGEPWDAARARSTLTDAPDVSAVYGVFWQGTLVATCSSQYQPERAPRSGYVHWVATDPEQRQRGLAAMLLRRVLEDFAERGYDSAYLVTQPERLPAIRSYLRFGFVPVYEAQGVDHTRLWSRLLQQLSGR